MTEQVQAGHKERDLRIQNARRRSRAKGATAPLSPITVVPPRARSRRGQKGHGDQSLPVAASLSEEKANSTAISMRHLPSLVGTIREAHRLRCDYHSAEKRLINQIKAIGRREEARSIGEAGGPQPSDSPRHTVSSSPVVHLDAVREELKRHRKAAEKTTEQMAKSLSVYAWVESVRGAGALGLGQIVGEAGDLSLYANPAKLWKRLGLGLYQRTDGEWERQRKASGADGVEAGYSPRRRAVMWNIGDCLIRAGGLYADLYRTRKEQEAAKPGCGKFKCDGPEGHCTKGHIHNRAKRWMEKRFIRDLWREWRK